MRWLIPSLILIAAAAWITHARHSSPEERQSALAAPRPLTIATNLWPGYEPLFLARDLGYFEGDAIRLVECANATQVIREFRNGTIDVAALTLDEVLLLRQHGHEAQIPLILDVSDGGDVILARRGIDEVRELEGHRVGVESGALGAFVLERALQSVGLASTAVTRVHLGVDEHERYFKEGRIDAVVTFEPVRSKLLEWGAVSLFDSSEIPGEIIDVLVVRPSVLTENPAALNSVLSGWFRALDYLEEKPDEASRRLAPRFGISPAEVLATYQLLRLPTIDQNLEMMRAHETGLVATGETLTKFLTSAGLLDPQKDHRLTDCFRPAPLHHLRANSSNPERD